MAKPTITTSVSYGHHTDPYADYVEEIKQCIEQLEMKAIDILCPQATASLQSKMLLVNVPKLNERMKLVLTHEFEGVGHTDRDTLMQKMIAVQDIEYKQLAIAVNRQTLYSKPSKAGK